MSNSIIIFTTIIANICDPQICYEGQKYSFLSNGLNQVIQQNCAIYMDQEILMTSGHCAAIPISLAIDRLFQKPMCFVDSAEETYNRNESVKITEKKKRKEDDLPFLIPLIVFSLLYVLCHEKEDPPMRYYYVQPRRRVRYYRRNQHIYAN